MNTDICIIGAGPVGIFSIFQAGMLGMKCHVIDALDFPGGQCSALYPEKPIYDIPAYPQITGQDLIANLMEQAKPFSPTFHFGCKATSITGNEKDGFILSVEGKSDKIFNIHAKAIIIAAGSGFFGPNRPPLENIEKHEGLQVRYFVDKMETFRDSNIVIAGGGDSAVDWAINLAPIAKSLAIVHRRNSFRCSPESKRQLDELSSSGKIQIIAPYQLHQIIEINGRISHIEVENIDDQKIQTLPCDYLLPFFGLKSDLGNLINWGFELSGKGIKVQHGTMETSKRGIYAVGDICEYEGKLKLIMLGFAESALALHHAYSIVFPGKAAHFEHSTSKGVPKQ